MGLSDALSIGNSAILAHQASIEVIGNNIANASTPSYTRQRAVLTPGRPNDLGGGRFSGTGVRMEDVQRLVDEALNARLRNAISEMNASRKRFDILGEIEAIEQELTDEGLNTRLSAFFNSWSELANNPGDESLKVVVTQEGERLSDFFQGMHFDLTDLRDRVDGEIQNQIVEANKILDGIAAINADIVVVEKGAGSTTSGANGLRDERDELLSQLSELIDISVVEQPSGVMDVFVDSIPIVLNTRNRGLDVDVQADTDGTNFQLRVRADGTFLSPRTGAISQLFESRETDVNNAVNDINEIARTIMFEVNKLHSSGQSSTAYTTLTSTYRTDDSSIAFNGVGQDLEFLPENGTFQIHVTETATNVRTTTQIDVDLDGLPADMSLDDVVAQLDAVDNISAVVNAAGEVVIDSSLPGFEFSFSDDTSGFLAALGINTFFDGRGSLDMRVRDELINDPTLLAVTQDHIPGGNGTAVEIANLKNAPIDSLNGLSIEDLMITHIEDYAARVSLTKARVQSETIIVENTAAQRQNLSGVSIDEESVNLIKSQQSFQAAARYIQTVQELLDIVTNLVR